jgi:asparagine synthase (glutamine-hydrolysing)
LSGILAVVNDHGAPPDPTLLEAMTSLLTAGAPGGRGSWFGDGVALGHSLLPTTFESEAERQPSTVDRHAWITADARVDGRDELLGELRAAGRPADAQTTDDLLILHAYGVWGERCVEHLIGDFAFAIWDADTRRLFCARDQFGIVPLYFARHPGGLVVCNAIGPLRVHPAVSDQLDERTIGDFLIWGRNMDVGRTSFADISALPPAHTLTWQAGSVDMRRYWDLPDDRREVRAHRSENHVEQFANVFEQAVSDRVRTDAVGAQLSGGLDSTSVAVMAHEICRSRGRPFQLRTYTVVYEWLVAEEEQRYAEQVAARIGVRSEYLVAEKFLTSAPEPNPSRVLAEPWAIAERVADYEAARRISQSASVLLTGFGGDPLLATGAASLGMVGATWASVREGRLPRPGLRSALMARRRGPAAPAVPDWIDPAFAQRIDLTTRLQELDTRSRRRTARELLRSPFWVDLFQSAHPGALGLPVKLVFPFFDTRLVQCVLETPPAPWRLHKRLLREAMRGRLPEDVRQRPKTLLYRAAVGPDRNHPLYKLGRLERGRGWREGLLGTPSIAEFIDPARALAAVHSPPESAIALQQFDSALALAHWLHHQRPAGRVPVR